MALLKSHKALLCKRDSINQFTPSQYKLKFKSRYSYEIIWNKQQNFCFQVRT